MTINFEFNEVYFPALLIRIIAAFCGYKKIFSSIFKPKQKAEKIDGFDELKS